MRLKKKYLSEDLVIVVAVMLFVILITWVMTRWLTPIVNAPEHDLQVCELYTPPQPAEPIPLRTAPTFNAWQIAHTPLTPLTVAELDNVDKMDYGPTPRYKLTADEMQLLYDIAWIEARGESDNGIMLVIHVILNRMAHDNFPDTVTDVIWQPRQFPTRLLSRATPCQRIKGVVREALRTEDISQGALFFRTIRGAEGSWHERALEWVMDYGGHRFFR